MEMLKAQGFLVTTAHKSVLGGEGLVVATHATGPGVEGITVLHDTCRLYPTHAGDAWVVEKSDTVPGPGPHDIRYTVDSLARAVQIVIDYYYGTPLVLDGWFLPAQGHPEWDRSRLPDLIRAAPHIRQAEWEEIWATYRKHYQSLLTRGAAKRARVTLADLYGRLFGRNSSVAATPPWIGGNSRPHSGNR